MQQKKLALQYITMYVDTQSVNIQGLSLLQTGYSL